MVAYCRILFLGFSYNLGDVSCFHLYPDQSYWFPISLFLPRLGADNIQSQGGATASCPEECCPRNPWGSSAGLPFHWCSARLPARRPLGAWLPVVEVLINQAESHRGAPPIQTFTGRQTRTRATPFFILPGGWRFLSPGAAFCCVLESVLLWALSWLWCVCACVCACLGRGVGNMPFLLLSSYYYH